MSNLVAVALGLSAAGALVLAAVAGAFVTGDLGSPLVILPLCCSVYPLWLMVWVRGIGA